MLVCKNKVMTGQRPKSKLEHLFQCLIEESSEVIEAVTKSERFGLLDVDPKTGLANWENLRIEVHHVMAVYQLYCEEVYQKPELSEHLIAVKKEELEIMMGLSRKNKLLVNENDGEVT